MAQADRGPGSRSLRPASTRSQARGERAGGLADAAAPGSRRHVGAGRGRPPPLSPGGARRERPAGPGGARSQAVLGRGRGGAWACALTRAGADLDWRNPRGRRLRRAQLHNDPGPRPRRGAQLALSKPPRGPDLLSSEGEFASRLSKMAFPGPGTNSSANKSILFRGQYGMVYQVPAGRQLQWENECELPAPTPQKFPFSAT